MTDDLYDLDGLAASLQAALAEELAAGGAEARAPAVELSLPARPEHGDVTTNAALITAKRAGRVPRELAEAVGARWLAPAGAGVWSDGWPDPNMLAVPCTVQCAAALQVRPLPPLALTFVKVNGSEINAEVWLFQ